MKQARRRTPRHPGRLSVLSLLCFIVLVIASLGPVDAQVLPCDRPEHGNPNCPEGAPLSLKFTAIPEPDNLNAFVADRSLAIALGKAFFWEMQAGSDGRQACATCHYHAGVDNRAINTLRPGPNGSFDTMSGPGLTLMAQDFPFEEDNDDIVGSQGVVKKDFNNIVEGFALDDGIDAFDPIFFGHRQVTGRQAPSVINAVFNHRSFWDGRAQNDFNGVDPFGFRNPHAEVWKQNPDGSSSPVTISLVNSSLASQAVGPPNSDVEMAWAGRTFPELGKKLLSLTPLATQQISASDSVLAPYRDPSGMGLTVSYEDLIKAAFHADWWGSTDTYSVACDTALPGESYSQLECNFALFWGLAVQLYESTLVSDDSAFDRFREGDFTAMTAQQVRGMTVFLGKASCLACHKGSEFTGASVNGMHMREANRLENGVIERMIIGNSGLAAYDNGYYNIGMRPTAEDPGVGGTDPWGNPLSFTRLAQQGWDVCDLTPFCVIGPGDRLAVDGNFKTPSLRNVELTGPYFHTGRYATLEQVVEFYDGGGDSEPVFNATGSRIGDSTGSGPLGQGEAPGGSNLDANIHPLGLSDQEQADLVAFLKSLTDHRVRCELAPFDHPELRLPNGVTIAAVGASGLPAAGQWCLTGFLPGTIGLTLYNADTDQELGVLNHGDVLDLNTLCGGCQVNIRAYPSQDPWGSVELTLRGPINTARTENRAPYLLAGDSGGDIFPMRLYAGHYTVSATPYEGASASGAKGNGLSVDFRVAASPWVPPAVVMGFTLYNADSDQVIASLHNGDTLNLATLCGSCQINIEAITSPPVTGSVRLELTGATSATRTENGAPYLLAGDKSGDLFPMTLNNGVYSLTATPYAGASTSGVAGAALTVEFTVP